MSTELIVEESIAFDQIDSLLVQHPFGNSSYITEELHLSYKRRLRKLSIHLPIAGQLLDALIQSDSDCQYRVIGDTVFRCAVQHAQVQVETGEKYGLPLKLCEEVFLKIITLLGAGKYGPIGSELKNRLGPNSYHGWIWSEDRTNDVFSQSFKYIVQDNYNEQLCTPNADELAVLVQGSQLLSELLPFSSRSALSHTHLIAVFPRSGSWATRLSSSEFRLSGTIFLGRSLLYNPWIVAEFLFHESLHQQLYDFRQGHSLLIPNFIREDAPLIHSLWNRPDSTRENFWDIHRSLAAFHVYVHLALLSTIAEQRAAELEPLYGPVRMVGRQTALARAHYLAEQIREKCWQELGPAGTQIMDWFGSVLELLDASPPAPGACIHLLLDRYWREAREIESLPREIGQHTELQSQLAKLIENEVSCTHRVLAELNEDPHAFNNALASLSEDIPSAKFVLVRNLIAKTILNISPSSFKLSESAVPDEMVKQMVENSSETLQDLKCLMIW